MKSEKSRYDYKKHLIHVLVAGAMAVSWATVTHVDTFIHSHLRRGRGNNTSQKSKPQIAPDQLTPLTAQNDNTPPIQASVKSVTAKIPVQASTPVPLASGVSKGRISVTISITDTKIDTGFIRLVEGSVLKGYVPLASTTRSGVTIADGFDLGQMRPAEFNQLPISSELKAKLLPYVGLTSLKAQAFVKAHPLTITNDELNQLNVIAANKILQPLVKAYNQSSGKSFTDLPAEAQTAIFSYAYQNGPGFMHKASAAGLWRCFVTQNWHQASATLRGFKMYASRRNQEAKLLDRLA